MNWVNFGIARGCTVSLGVKHGGGANVLHLDGHVSWSMWRARNGNGDGWLGDAVYLKHWDPDH